MGKKAIVVGAGIGGVAVAARLAKSGFKVTVVEKNEFTGGRCSILHHEGHRFDQGPSLLLLPKIFRETFADLDTSLEAEGVELLKCDPNYNVFFADGETLELSTDLSRMKREIERYEGKAGFERYLAFLAQGHRHYEISVREVLHRPFNAIQDMLRWSFVSRVFALHPFESIYSRASKYFRSERLRRAFTFGSMYMGMSPFDAPGTYSLLQYTELAEGIWYPVGGFHRVVEALVAVGERYGVEYRLGTAVDRIIHADDTDDCAMPNGVRLASGEEILADVVVINADLVYAYNNLFPAVAPGAPRDETVAATSAHAKKLGAKDSSCSSISFYWSLDCKFPALGTHNIFLADEYRDSFDDIFERQTLPGQPSFYVNVPSRIDPTAAPPGRDSVVVLVPVGHLGRSASNASKPTDPAAKSTATIAADVVRARACVLQTIRERTGVDLGPHIRHEALNDPHTWQARFNLDKGSILGLSHAFLNVLALRPRWAHRGSHGSAVVRAAAALLPGDLASAPGQRGVWFVGASAHPGTGVPIVLAGAKMVAAEVLREADVRPPWCVWDDREARWTQRWDGVVDDAGKQATAGVRVAALDRQAAGQWAVMGLYVLAALVGALAVGFSL